MLYYEQRGNIVFRIYIKREGVTLATFMDISLEEDTIHCQDFQGLHDCIHSRRKLLGMKKRSQKGDIWHHLNQLINMDKTVTPQVEKLAAFQNRYNPSSAAITGVMMGDLEVLKKINYLSSHIHTQVMKFVNDSNSAGVLGSSKGPHHWNEQGDKH